FIVPFFWCKDDYFVAFPFYWDFGKPFDSEKPDGTNSLFPLWIYDADSRSKDLHLLWPLFNFERWKNGGYHWHLFPLVGQTRKNNGHSAWWLAKLGGYNYTENSSAHWQFPFYFYGNYENRKKGNDHVFLSPFWFDIQQLDVHSYAIPPLLTWQTGNEFYSLAGLFNQRLHTPWKKSSGYFFPFYAYDNNDDSFLSLAYSSFGDTTFIPPLLSWWNRGPKTYGTDLWLFGGLFRQNFHAPENQTKGHLLPLYAYGKNGDDESWFYTPIYGQNRDQNNKFRYYLTPIVGSEYHDWNKSRAWWLFPLVWHDSNPRLQIGDTLEYARAFFDKDAKERPPSYHYSKNNVLLGMLAGSKYEQSFERYLYNSIFRKSRNRPNYSEKSSFYIFPFWQSFGEKLLVFDNEITGITHDDSLKKNSVLFFLYDYKHEHSDIEEHDYVRRRVLWRLYHYERLNGDVALDIFPAITWDSKTDGARKFSFLWRFFRYESAPDKNTKLDILFIPIRR
ncbi:MAG: hypothetical protein FWG05_04600, partial [Kiritimatiellaeota bacterium]|nr:hypothetical protein [Kiritimatiellota bacterium]